jgi:hypothetical protein
MKSTFLISMAAVFMMFAVLACDTGQAEWKSQRVDGSGSVVRVSRDVSDFTGVHLSTIGTVHVKIGKVEGLDIEAEENLIEYIETEVKDGTLKISNRRKFNLKAKEPIKYFVTVKKLDRIALSSSGDAILPVIENNRFSIALSSSGDLQAQALAVGHLDVNLSSSGDAYIERIGAESIDAGLSSSGDLQVGGGEVEILKLSISSSGDFDGVDLKAGTAAVRLSSSGDAYLWVTDALVATLSSSGSVHYSGDPIVTKQRSSSGKVKRMGN